MFENEFMKINTSIISICTEFAQNKADYICVYIFIDNDQYYFNSLFGFGKEVWDVEELEYPDDSVKYFRSLIEEESRMYSDIFQKYKREEPILYRMLYRSIDQGFKFKLMYSSDIGDDYSCEKDFHEWKERVKRRGVKL